MAAADTTVKKIEIRASTTGIDQARSQASNLEQTLNAVAAANEKLAAAFSQASAANDNFIQAQEKANKTWVQSARDLLTWLDLFDRLKGTMKSATDITKSHFGEVSSGLLAYNRLGAAITGVTIPGLAALSRVLGPVTFAFHAVGASIAVVEKANADFSRMVELGRQAAALDVGANFIKQFQEAGKVIRASREEMDKALESASKFVQAKFNQPDALQSALSGLSQGGFLGGSKTDAERMAETATTTAEKIRAAAEAMKELEASGNNLAAIDLAEKVFGADVADRLRRGVTDAAALAEALSKAAEQQVVDEAQVARSTALANEIERVKNEIREAWAISIDFSSITETIKGIWLGILNAVNAVSQAIANIHFPQVPAGLMNFLGKLGGNPEEIGAQILSEANQATAKPRAVTTNQVFGPAAPFSTTSQQFGPSISEMDKLQDKVKKAGGAAKETADEFEQMVKRIEDTTRKAAEQATTYGQGAAEAARYRAEQELLTAAERAGREKTAELIAQVKDLSDKAGQAADNLARVKITKDIGFDRSTALLSDPERNIAEKLKPLYGNDVQASLQSAEASQIRINNALKDFRNIAGDAMTGFVSDLSKGVKASEALANAMKKVGDTLISSGINTALSGAATGNFAQAGVGAAEVGVGFLLNSLGPSEKSKQRKQQMMDAWAKAQQDEFDTIQAQQQAVIDAGIASAQASQKAAEDAIKKAEDALRRIESFQDRAAVAGIDTSTTAGQLAVFDLQAQRQREAEIRAGGEAIVALEEALYEERERIVRDGVDALLAQDRRLFDEAQQFLVGFAKSIRQFLDNLTAGPGSTLSPQDRLTAAQSQFETQYTLGQGGNRDALSGLTNYASNLLEASKAFYGSTAGYQNTYNDVTSRLSALPAIVSPEQLIVNAIDGQTTSLSQLLNELDTNGDGMISRQEAANSWLSQVFSELDTNGDGQISRLELIKSATQGTEGNVDTTIGQNSTSNNYLDAVAINTQQLATIQQQLQNIFNTTAKTSNNAARTANNTMYSANADTQSSAGIAGDFTYARGGWVYGAGGGTSDSIRAMLSNGEYVVRAQAASALRPYMDTINQGRLPTNDNDAAMGALLAEVRTLRAEITMLRTENTRAIVAAAEYDREGMGQMTDTMNELVRETKRSNAA
jgi:hypothetical protein